ncbi:hypothetical protein Tco_0003549 [Tanacetum coccineum]
MADLKFADTHNLVAFLSKPAESEGFEQIVDFLNANPIRYALTINPTIYISCIEQFWSTVKAKTINGEVQLHALVDGKKVIITKSTVRRDLQLEDVEGVDCLSNSTIFEQLTLMGSRHYAALKNVTILGKREVIEETECTKAMLLVTKFSAATTTITTLHTTPRKGIVITELEIDEEERLTREKDEANVALTKMDDYSMLKFDVDTSWLKDCKLKNNKATKIKELMKIIPDEREVAIDAIPLATKPPTIVD